jgi:RND family efflux transporter MFP subunit
VKSGARKALAAGVGVALVAAGIGVRMYLVATKPEPDRVEPPDPRTLVEVVVAQKGDHDVVLTARGTVVPAQQVTLLPQVGGRVVWMADELVPGGRFARGETVVRIDPSDYEAIVEQRAADLNRAELEQRVEAGRGRIAEREWQLFDDDARENEEGRALALRQPHLETAQVSVRAAESAVRRARLDLSRTRIVAPFNAMVQRESADLGQVVGPTSQVATLVGTDAFWVQVSVPVESLSHVRVPGYNATEGSAVVIVHDLGAERIEREGRVLRLFGDLDPAGQMARLLVEIRDPFDLEHEQRGLPLLLGSYVRVDLDATTIENAVEVPRFAIRDGNYVWIMDRDDRLAIREVGVAWRLEETVLVTRGVETGERVVTSRIPSSVEGMRLRTREEEPPARSGRAQAER